MKQKLAIISGKIDQSPLVNKANEMGIETHCFAWDKKAEDVYCRDIADYFHPISILEKEQILEKCKEIKIDGITTILSDYAVPTVAYVAQHMGLPGNRYEDMLMVGCKFTQRQAFAEHGVNSPRFALAQEGVDLLGFKYPLIVKSTDRSTAIGVIKVENEEDLQEAIQQAQDTSFSKNVIIEEFIEGFEVSVDTISWNGEHYIMAIKERVMILEDHCPRKIEGHYPFELPVHVQDKIKTETFKALNAINYKYGASNTEFRLTEDNEIFAIEVNPRMAGDFSHILMKLYNGYDVLKGVIDVALGQFEKPVFPYQKYSGVYYYRKSTEWIKKIIENKENDQDIVQGKIFEGVYEIVGRKGYFIYQSDHKRRWAENQ